VRKPLHEQELKQKVLRWAAILQVTPKIIRVQKMSRKWGSCSTAGIVTFADDLSYQEEPFQNYVIVHELLHLRVPTHGRLFKALMSIHVPEWRKLDFQRWKESLD
jgi:predicted metal-dependent hydrolase